jgi:hypothetical protein
MNKIVSSCTQDGSSIQIKLVDSQKSQFIDHLSILNIPILMILVFNALIDQIGELSDIFTIETPEPPKILYKIFYRGILIIAAGIDNSEIITYKLSANKKIQKTFYSFNDLLDNFYDYICDSIKLYKIDIREKKIKINKVDLINTIIENAQRENAQRENAQRENTQSIYSSPLFSTGDEICDAYNEGAKDMRDLLIEQLLTSATESSNVAIKKFLQDFFKLS